MPGEASSLEEGDSAEDGYIYDASKSCDLFELGSGTSSAEPNVTYELNEFTVSGLPDRTYSELNLSTSGGLYADTFINGRYNGSSSIDVKNGDTILIKYVFYYFSSSGTITASIGSTEDSASPSSVSRSLDGIGFDDGNQVNIEINNPAKFYAVPLKLSSPRAIEYIGVPFTEHPKNVYVRVESISIYSNDATNKKPGAELENQVYIGLRTYGIDPIYF